MKKESLIVRLWDKFVLSVLPALLGSLVVGLILSIVTAALILVIKFILYLLGVI